MKCEHLKFKAEVNVFILTNDKGTNIGHTADISICCADCDTQMQFIGVPGGVNPTYPTTNVDHTELRAPLVAMDKPKKITKEVN